jgi:FlaA1/EpsC-like NDP-sugar epimerase
LLEASELALYEIERELRSVNARLGNTIELVALLGNAHHKHRVREIITTLSIQTIYHAAAYKHVPIVEHNMIEGIHNNIFATYNTAEAAMECRVETFVLISTDKAVNPTTRHGVHQAGRGDGVQGLQQRSRHRFCMVRFRQRARVFGISSAVVPRTDSRRRPVTVTHPDVIRYFHDHPGSRLVIQAGGPGRRCSCSEWQSVRIADLAKRMIQLAGYTSATRRIRMVIIEIRSPDCVRRETVRRTAHRQECHGTEHPRILRAIDTASWNRCGTCSMNSQCPRCGSTASAPARSGARGARISRGRKGSGPRLAAGRFPRQRRRPDR